MRDLGYVDGRSAAIEYRWAAGDVGRLPAMAADLVRLNVDVIVTSGAPASRAAKAATTTIPIVMASVGDAVSYGLVASFARPGGNVTGFSVFAGELSRKRLEILNETVPGLTRVGALYNVLNPQNPPQFRATVAAGDALGLKVSALEIRFPDGVEPAFEAASREGIQGIVILSDTATIAHRTQLGTAGLRYRLPTIFSNKSYLEGGGLMSYGPDIVEIFRRSASYVDRVLRGTKPADLPVEQPSRFELALNLPTARALGPSVPPTILQRADHLIE